MNELGFSVSFNSISVISEGWTGEQQRLCAMKRLLGSERISRDSNPGPRDPKLGALTARSLLLYYGYVLGRDRVLKCVWNRVGA